MNENYVHCMYLIIAFYVFNKPTRLHNIILKSDDDLAYLTTVFAVTNILIKSC
jgi:hypothetical protein